MSSARYLFAMVLLGLACQESSAAATVRTAITPQLPSCGVSHPNAKAAPADVRARGAAQAGLTYLAKASTAWTQQHQCFGCHVQAVTLEALTAAKHYHYEVPDADLNAMKAALKLGVTAGGRTTGIAFEGAAWARYDRFVDATQTAELLRYATDLLGVQAQDGSIPDDDARLPITGGTMQTTFQAAQTWRQAFARTADDRWLGPLRRAEGYLTARTDGWGGVREVYVQDIDFALLGLSSTGVTRSEPASRSLQDMILERQNQDGGWGLTPGQSDAFATGQAIYALKMAGFADRDPAIARGTAYLLAVQSPDGAWRTASTGQHGAEKGETMWAVLGLVTTDVASIEVQGIIDGQHVGGPMHVRADAVDNQSGGIAKLSFFVDDVENSTACGANLTTDFDASALAPGKHIVDLVATTGMGQQSRRRFEVFAGDVFLTHLAAGFDEATQKTRVSLRNIAEPNAPGVVELEIWSLTDQGEQPKTKVFATKVPGKVGPMQLEWDGNGSDGNGMPRGRYLAKVAFRDAAGGIRQTESSVFLHDSDAVARASFGEVEGSLAMDRLGIGSANTLVELVDGNGNVVQAVRSTEAGQYRFKNVTPGNYRVRASKKGFAAQEAPVSASKAAPAAKADFAWH